MLEVIHGARETHWSYNDFWTTYTILSPMVTIIFLHTSPIAMCMLKQGGKSTYFKVYLKEYGKMKVFER